MKIEERKIEERNRSLQENKKVIQKELVRKFQGLGYLMVETGWILCEHLNF